MHIITNPYRRRTGAITQAIHRVERNATVMFSESAGRFIVTIDPKNREVFESLFQGLACACVGTVSETPQFEIKGRDHETIVSVTVNDLKSAWKKPFGNLI